MGEGDTEAGGYRFGILCLFAATFFTSLAGVILRHVETADGWQVLFYRSLALVATLVPFLLWRHGAETVRAFRAVGGPGLAVAVFLGSAFILFIFALLETTVASVVFTLGLSPFVAAAFAWLALREPVGRSTLAAMGFAVVGIAFMFGDGLAAGSLLGNLLALVCCFCYAAAIVAMRKGRAVDMLPAVCLAGVFAALVSAVMTGGDLAVSPRDLGLAASLGVVQVGFQYILVTTGTRYVPAAEVALIGRLVLVLGPLWVWLAVDEVPGGLTLAGGAVVLVAILAHGALALRRPVRAG
jgi:drug/metabolite transporter (DMT)-like permease